MTRPLGITASAKSGGASNGPPVTGAVAWWSMHPADDLVQTSLGVITDVFDGTGNNNDLFPAPGGGPAYEGTLAFGGTEVAVFSGSQGLQTIGDIGASGDHTTFVMAYKTTGSQTGGNADVLITLGGMSTYISTATLTIWKGTGSENLTSDAGVWQPAQIHTRMLQGFNHSYWLEDTAYLLGSAGDPGISGAVFVGVDSDGNAGSDWQVAEIVVYDFALTSLERADVRTWLNGKWFGA